MLISKGLKKRNFSFLSLAFISLVSSNLAFSAPNNDSVEHKLVGGFYFDEVFSNAYPLLLSSQDNGQSWSFIKNVPMSSYRIPHYITSLSCTGNACVVGGWFGDYYPFPLLLKTLDGGQSWSYERNIKGLPHIEDSYLGDTNCFENTCLASGAYGSERSNDRLSFPFLLISNDKGQSWTSINNIKDMPEEKIRIAEDAFCDGNACVGILHHGPSFFKENSRPIVSVDKGQSWSYIKTIDNLPQTEQIVLSSIRCQENTCVAGGYANPSEDGRSFQPMLIISQDKGLHWSRVENLSDLPGMKRGNINKLSYNADIWVAAGTYGNTNDTEMKSPLLLVSKDKGLHWSFVKNITDLPDKSTRINALACDQGFCVAGGYYMKDFVNEPDGYELPVLLVSHDNGQSFKFIKQIENLPTMKGAMVSSINCSHGYCTAIGHYDDVRGGDDHNSAIYYPFVLTSSDKGEHWSFVKINDLPEMRSGNIDSITGSRSDVSNSSMKISNHSVAFKKLKERMFFKTVK